MLISVTALSYLICGLVYILAAALMAVTKAQHRYKLILIGACILMAAWSGAVTLAEFAPSDAGGGSLFATVLEQLRSAGWVAVVAYVLFFAYRKAAEPIVAATYAAVLVLSMVFVVWHEAFGALDVAGLPGSQSSAFASILIATCGLAIVENLFRNSGRDARWALKYLCFGLAGIFGYDLILQARLALFGQYSEGMYAARGIVDAMMAPLIIVAAARSKKWPIDLHISRRLVFHSATILVAGVYLLGVSAIGYYLRLLDSQWGLVARVGFVAVALLALAIAVTSSAFQARIKNFINRNFFSYRYDYRQEWLDFIDAVSGKLAEYSIPERIVRALANLLDCTAGAIWIHVEEDNTYRRSGSWNIDGLPPNVSLNDPLPVLLASTQGVIVVRLSQIDGAPLASRSLPEWLTGHPRTWLTVPLTHSSGLIGFVVLGRPRAERELNWEDFELVKTAGRQAASYIAEDLAATSLVKARRFEDFNRQFAFVVHDIKNLAGQMSLILKNAERHGSDPRFQKDVLATVADSLARMQALLSELKQRRTTGAPLGRVDLGALLERLAVSWRLQMQGLQLAVPARSAEVVADSSRLEAVFNHLVQNAAEASGPTGRVEVKIDDGFDGTGGDSPSPAGWVTVEVVDNGPGMDQAFIDEKLFQPMSTTKSSGLGIGAYQVLCLVREMGGTLDVKSRLGEGTRMNVRLPRAPALAMAPTGRVPTPAKLAT